MNTIRLNTIGDSPVVVKKGSQVQSQEKTVEITENGTTEVVPDAGYALSKVTVNTNVESSGSAERGNGWYWQIITHDEATNLETDEALRNKVANALRNIYGCYSAVFYRSYENVSDKIIADVAHCSYQAALWAVRLSNYSSIPEGTSLNWNNDLPIAFEECAFVNTIGGDSGYAKWGSLFDLMSYVYATQGGGELSEDAFISLMQQQIGITRISKEEYEALGEPITLMEA